MSHRGMVIVGAGEAGCRAALGLRGKGYKGPISLLGGEAHVPYERPPLSKPQAGDSAIAPRPIVAKEHLTEAGITYLGSTKAVAIDRAARAVALDDGRALAYDKLLLATGASARRLDKAPVDHRVVTIRTLDDARRFHSIVQPGAKLVMIGAGFIGLELAAIARQRGAEVIVIEALDRILKRGVPEPIAAIIAARHAAAGVRVVTGANIVAIEPGEADVTVRLETDERLVADLVVLGIGASPNVELARSSGLSCDNGIEVDAKLTTSDPRIFAAGDCCSFPAPLYGGKRIRLESWRNAQEQGEHAAHAMLGGAEPFDMVPWFWSDQYDLGLQVVGLADAAASSVERPIGEQGLVVFHLGQGGQILAASAIGSGTTVAREIKVAEAMIRNRVRADPTQLANSAIKLKSLLRPQSPQDQ
jgi:3-phenylpropionate/trans-cinnamate dioxygenase ferredoxin reductase component